MTGIKTLADLKRKQEEVRREIVEEGLKNPIPWYRWSGDGYLRHCIGAKIVMDLFVRELPRRGMKPL